MINLKDIKKNLFKKENIYFFVLILFIFFLDRYSKNFILNNFREKRLYINDFLNFDLTWNTGMAFGLFSSDLEIIYNSLTFLIGVVIFILFYLLLISAKLDKLIYCIIIGGAIGNFYDRLQYKAVPDFIDFHINNFHWFTFNISDVFISFGVLVFILKGFYEKN
ncbi:MAG: signal peptidase II [Pseudomonadota bacterium]|nr:signal peptidase II [Pseudomonadota bacterium]